MSWQTYVDDHLLCDIDGQRLTAAAIVGHDGSVWAQSENFPQGMLCHTSCDRTHGFKDSLFHSIMAQGLTF